VTAARLDLELDGAAVRRLIPHRPPFLLVDRVRALRPGERPELWTERAVTGDEPVLAGHFPGHPIWPGAYTMEGLGQTALLLALIARLMDATGASADALARIGRDDADPSMIAALDEVRARLAVAGQYDIKFLAPVRPPALLVYHAQLTHVVDGAMARFDVDAAVDGVPVARGRITGVVGGPAR
jgi:3-hydroxyacyl-[acyl-carrier-protein] dehydratase